MKHALVHALLFAVCGVGSAFGCGAAVSEDEELVDESEELVDESEEFVDEGEVVAERQEALMDPPPQWQGAGQGEVQRASGCTSICNAHPEGGFHCKTFLTLEAFLVCCGCDAQGSSTSSGSTSSRPTTGCSTTADCRADRVCSGNRCVARRCNSAASCGPGQGCLNGYCVLY